MSESGLIRDDERKNGRDWSVPTLFMARGEQVKTRPRYKSHNREDVQIVAV